MHSTVSSIELLDLTTSQSLIWTGQGLQPDDPLYNMVLAFRIRGTLEAELFQDAFQSVVNACDALRTRFVVIDGNPKRQVLDSAIYAMPVEDFSIETDPDAAAAAWIDAHKICNFDLALCLFDSALLRLREDDYIWYLNQHHLITDAWSVSVMYQKMAEYYGTVISGNNAVEFDMPRFEDYVAFEQSLQSTRAFEKAATYWRQQLVAPSSPSSFYRRTPTKRSGRTDRIPCEIGIERSMALRSMADDPDHAALTSDMARFQIFLTVLFAYLYRLGGNRNVAIGTPSHNRAGAKQKATVGLFIEVYPLRVSIDDEETFLSLYRKVARASKEFLINAQPGVTDAAYIRAFDVLLNYITASFGAFGGLPTQAEWIHSDHGDRNHLLRLQVHDFDQSDEFVLFFDLNVDTFIGEEQQWVKKHYLCLLDAYLNDPNNTIDAVSLITPSDIRDGTQCSTKNVELPIDTVTVYELFEARAAAHPDDIALVCGSREFSYGNLNAYANQIAHYLISAEVGSGSTVGVILDRSIEAVAAILGILKSGAAYVPIDPSYPIDRIEFMRGDATVALSISTTLIATRIGLKPDECLLLDGPVDVLANQIREDPGLQILPTDDIYVIYTSGSTGRPKGVAVTHGNVTNYVVWAKNKYVGVGKPIFPLFSSLSFDLTVTSIFVPLIAGGQIIIYPEPSDTREITIRRVIEDNAVNVIKLTPAHLALVQSMDLSQSSLQTLILGGEDLKTDVARTVSKYFADEIEIFNEYGPTEATVGCMIHRFEPAIDSEVSVPIGRAIDNAKIYILDANGGLLPQGIVGEIYISGAGVARGYLNRPSETAERFLEDPYTLGATMYRSGDLGRWRSDGNLEYLGREDQQVKIRGVRIELGEVEAAVLQHDGISACVVSALERGQSGASSDVVEYCVRCGLASNHPDAELDEKLICRACNGFETEKRRAADYFRNMDELRSIVHRIRTQTTKSQDCMMLLSGGKDSTYALAQLVDVGLTPLVFTLDNGYISDGAKQNIRGVVEQLGLELIEAKTDAMGSIFVDSLNRHSNVCNGCFKTIYTLSMNIAHQRGIKTIFTGLSRGQIYQTRIADLFKQKTFDPATIDRTIIDARKVYHRMDDVVSRTLDVEIFKTDAIFDEIEFIDFYRYCEATLDEVYDYLRSRVPWVRPADTGRSTNCLINEAGIFVHKRERGFHNYALPYSWDVRLGHKQRDAALAELDDEINVDNVNRILREIGYNATVDVPMQRTDHYLVAYYVAHGSVAIDEVKTALASRLPNEYIPTQFVRLDELPLTQNGKVDRDALPQPDNSRPDLAAEYIGPSTEKEKLLVSVWQEIFGIDKIGVNDNFFDLGGDSILNIQIVAGAKSQGLALSPQQVFDSPTIAELAVCANAVAVVEAEQGTVAGEVTILPAQASFLAGKRPQAARFDSIVTYEIDFESDPDILERVLNALVRHHDAFRSRFVEIDGEWNQIIEQETQFVELERVDLPTWTDTAGTEQYARIGARLRDGLDITRGQLMRAALGINGSENTGRLFIVVHPLIADHMSWLVLLEDLRTSYRQLADGVDIKLPPKTTSVRQFGDLLTAYAASTLHGAALSYWDWPLDSVGSLPCDAHDVAGETPRREVVTVNLNEQDTLQLLYEVPSTFHAEVPDIILTAVVRVIARWTKNDVVQVDLEGSLREGLIDGADLSRTVGSFTTIFPVQLKLDRAAIATESLKSVKEQLRAIPNRGNDYAISLHSKSEQEFCAGATASCGSETVFTYLGRIDQATVGQDQFRMAYPILFPPNDAGAPRYLLDLSAMIFQDRLYVEWHYSSTSFQPATVQRFAGDFVKELQTLIAHSVATPTEEFTPSDFPAANLTQEALETLLADFGETDE